jgi:hypothetical protein
MQVKLGLGSEHGIDGIDTIVIPCREYTRSFFTAKAQTCVSEQYCSLQRTSGLVLKNNTMYRSQYVSAVHMKYPGSMPVLLHTCCCSHEKPTHYKF